MFNIWNIRTLAFNPRHCCALVQPQRETSMAIASKSLVVVEKNWFVQCVIQPGLKIFSVKYYLVLSSECSIAIQYGHTCRQIEKACSPGEGETQQWFNMGKTPHILRLPRKCCSQGTVKKCQELLYEKKERNLERKFKPSLVSHSCKVANYSVKSVWMSDCQF